MDIFYEIIITKEEFMKKITIIGGGLAGSEAALQLAKREIYVDLYEMCPEN